MQWKVVSASVAGSSHEKNGIPCQDAHAWRTLPGGLFIAAAADGAGSARRSQEGSALAVEAALAFLHNALLPETDKHYPNTELEWENLLKAVFTHTIEQLHILASETGEPVREFSTTLMVTAASPEWLAVGQIGDGAIVARLANGSLLTVAEPQRGEYAGETYFLSMPGALQYMVGRVYSEQAHALALMTDGLTRLAFSLPDHQPHPQFFNPLLAFSAGSSNLVEAEQALSAFLRSERIVRRTDDDITLILAAALAEIEPDLSL